MYGQFLASPNHRTLILISNPDIRSARLYGQFSLDKRLTLQAGSTVLSVGLKVKKMLHKEYFHLSGTSSADKENHGELLLFKGGAAYTTTTTAVS